MLFAATLPALVLVDRAGRVALLKWSAAGMLGSAAALAALGRAFPRVACGAIFSFLVHFSYGWGPVVWVYCAEMFPAK